MQLTPSVVEGEREWVLDRGEVVVPLINGVRADLGEAFDTSVDTVSRNQYDDAVREVFADGDLGVNVAALVSILRELDVENDYPGFVVDEFLGRKLAAAIAGGQPLALLAEATFHYADVTSAETPQTATAGGDDLDAALAAGFQTRLPGWSWREEPSQFGVSDD